MICENIHTVLISDRFTDGNGCLLVRVLKDQDFGELDTEPNFSC